MKKSILFLSLFFVSINFVVAQAPGIKWQKCIGGYKIDCTTRTGALIRTRDSGFIVVGVSASYGISQHPNNADACVIKLDKFYNIQWQTSFGSELHSEEFNAVCELPNGDLVATGERIYSSYINEGYSNAFVVRMDKSGNPIWEKTYGGSGADFLYHIKPTTDGNLVLCGETNSMDGDVSGSHGTSWNDAWIVKIDLNGNIIWQKCLGGTSSELARDIIEFNGSYLMLGNTGSRDGDVSGLHGTGSDAWLVSLSPNGEMQWQKCVGGTGDYDDGYSIEKTIDGGFVIGGLTNSGDGDMIGNHGGYTDGFIGKFDKSATLLWTKCIGSSSADDVRSVIQKADGTFVAVGRTDFSNGDFSTNYGGQDAWIGAVSSEGNLLWTKTLGGSNYDEANNLIQVNDDDYLIVSRTKSNDFNVSGNNGGDDFWLTYVGKTNSIHGMVYVDENGNGIKDSWEQVYNNAIIKSYNDRLDHSAIPFNGYYSNYLDTGTFTTQLIFSKPYYKAKTSVDITYFGQYFKDKALDFALTPIPGMQDVSISVVPLAVARPGFKTDYLIIYRNIGTVAIPSDFLKVSFDSRLRIDSFSTQPSDINGNVYYWEFENFKPNEVDTIFVRATVSSAAPLNDTLLIDYLINPVVNDQNPLDNIFSLRHFIRGAYDPNDKTENHAGSISKNDVANGDWLTYTVRFQNTGTDTAFNIIIRDTLDNKLDWNSLEMITANHNYQLNITDGNKCAWYFNNILLPDSNVNKAASHGYIVYRIKPKPTLVAGDVINNTASIYFDYNLSVQTNTEKTVVANDLMLPLQLLSFSANHNGKANLLKWSTAREINTDRFEIQRSSNGRDFTNIGTVRSLNNGKNTNEYSFTDAHPLKQINYYRLKMIDKDGKFTYSAIKNINNSISFDVTLYPNPVYENLTLNFITEKAIDIQVEIANAEGKKMWNKKIQLPNGSSRQSIHTAAFGAGNYFVKCTAGNEQIGLKFLKQ